jgi:hypothetical protein
MWTFDVCCSYLDGFILVHWTVLWKIWEWKEWELIEGVVEDLVN